MNLPEKYSAAIQTADRTNYLNQDYTYLKNVTISEWDIKSAGFSVLKFRKLLPEDQLKELEQLPKEVRTVKEGLLQKSNPKIAESIVNTLATVRKAYVILNNIEDYNILSIKKDAMFLINTNPVNNTVKDYFVFRKKNTYTTYINLNRKEFYYNSGTDVLDIKGISDENVEKSQRFLADIKKFLKSAEILQPIDLYKLLKNYRRKYLNFELPVESYRELDTGKFRLGDYEIENISDNEKHELDISQNYLNYILPLINNLI